MAKPIWMAAALLSAVFILSSCGGGGSGDAPATGNPGTGNPGTGTPGTGGGADNSWLSFSPASISHTAKERSFAVPITVVATSSKTIVERVNVAIVDTSGVLDANETTVTALSATSYEANMSLSPTLKPGKYQGFFKVQLCLDDPQVCNQPYSGSPWQIAYDIEVKPWAQPRTVHKLLVSDTGVALTSMSDFALLTRSIRVSDNLGQAGRWQARSDQPWLTVTPSGAVGEALQIQADPSALAENTISYATVSVTSPDATVGEAQPVVVALWKGKGPVRQLASSTTEIARYKYLLADPVRPHAYAHSGGGKIDVYNIYTGAQEGTLTAAGAAFGKMVVSSDGAFLYAVDWASSQLRVFDLRSRQLTSSWPLDTVLTGFDSGYVDMVYARPNGIGIVVLTTGQVFRASDGKVLATKVATAERPRDQMQFFSVLKSSYLAVSPDGLRIYSTSSRQRSPNTPFYWDMDYSEVDSGTLSFTKPYLASPAQERLPQAGGIAISRDGKRVLMLSYGGGVSLWSPEDLSRAGMLTQGLSLNSDTLIVAADGRIIVVDMMDNWKFNILSPSGNLLKTQSTVLPASTVKPGDSSSIYAWTSGMVVSADGAVVIQSASLQVERDSAYLLTFTPITP